MLAQDDTDRYAASALELADVGDPRAPIEAIAILDRLGARPAAERVRDRVHRGTA